MTAGLLRSCTGSTGAEGAGGCPASRASGRPSPSRGLAFLAPQIPGIAAGFAIIWALAWRRQDAAVAAIEERDGAAFYVRRTSSVRPMSLVRTPGYKALRPERANGTVG